MESPSISFSLHQISIWKRTDWQSQDTQRTKQYTPSDILALRGGSAVLDLPSCASRSNDQWLLGGQNSSLLGPKEQIKTCTFLEMAHQHKSKGFVSPLQTPTGVRSKALEGHICTFHMDICLGVIHQHEIHCMTPYLEVSKPQSVKKNHL